MKKIKCTLKVFVFVAVLCCISTTQTTAQAKKYIAKYQQIVDSLHTVYQIPRSVIFGISIIESGMGKSKNCKLLKNHFGIIGKNKVKKTHGVSTRFKQFERDEDSFIAFCKLVSKRKYYSRLKGNLNYKLWIQAIAASGYSTTPDIWKAEMTRSINTYKLYTLDGAKAVK